MKKYVIDKKMFNEEIQKRREELGLVNDLDWYMKVVIYRMHESEERHVLTPEDLEFLKKCEERVKNIID